MPNSSDPCGTSHIHAEGSPTLQMVTLVVLENEVTCLRAQGQGKINKIREKSALYCPVSKVRGNPYIAPLGTDGTGLSRPAGTNCETSSLEQLWKSKEPQEGHPNY